MTTTFDVKGLQCSLLTTLTQLEEIATSWDALLSQSATNEPMQSSIWLHNWWRVYGGEEGRQLRVLTIRRDDRLIGIAPFSARPVRHLRALALQRLELMGTGEREEDETCSEYVGLIAARGEEQCVSDVFGACLHEGAMGVWDEVVMPAMSSEATISALTAKALGRATKYEIQSGAPFIALPNSWDDYMKGMSSSRRYLIRRSVRAWEKWAGEEPTLHKIEKAEDVDKGFELLANLHAERWKDKCHVGAFTSPLFESFHRQTMHDLFAAGALWLCWLEVKGKPVAALYNIVWNKQVRFYQSGRVMDVPQKVRPGVVMHACAIRQAIELGYTHYDFLAGTTRYKMQLANNVRPLVQLSVNRAGAKGRIKDLSTAGLDMGRSLRDAWQAHRNSKVE